MIWLKPCGRNPKSDLSTLSLWSWFSFCLWSSQGQNKQKQRLRQLIYEWKAFCIFINEETKTYLHFGLCLVIITTNNWLSNWEIYSMPTVIVEFDSRKCFNYLKHQWLNSGIDFSLVWIKEQGLPTRRNILVQCSTIIQREILCWRGRNTNFSTQ